MNRIEGKELSVNHLIGIQTLTKEDIELIFETATYFKGVINRPIKKVPSLQDVTIANIFFEDSTRTKSSFELAEKRLSADVINFSTGQSSVKKGETLLDTVNNILAMKVDLVVMRHGQSGAAQFLAEQTNTIVVNAGDGAHEHPTQALLDGFSILQEKGSLLGQKVLIVGDILRSRVALSNIFLLTKMGVEVAVCGPLSLIPKDIEALGVKVLEDFDKALQWAEVVYLLRIQKERLQESYFPSEAEYRNRFGLTQERVDRLQKKWLIMHPGPINRGIEIESSVVDSPQGVVLEQVENGVAIRMAVIYLLTSKLNKYADKNRE